MQTGLIFIYFIVPVFLEGCCVGNHQKRKTDLRGPQHDARNLHYRAVEGEIFMVPCINKLKKTDECRQSINKGSSFNCGTLFLAEAKHSGNYTCDSGGSKIFFFLQVVERIRCISPEKSRENLRNAAGGKITCPGHSCFNNSNMSWYKGDRAVSEQHRASCQENGLLHLCKVSYVDAGVYFCDRQIIEQGVIWTFRSAVNVSVLPFTKGYPPKIVVPESNTTKEVELVVSSKSTEMPRFCPPTQSQSYTLTCRVNFPLDTNSPANVQWFMNYGEKMDNMTPIHMDKPQQKTEIFEEIHVIQKAIIKEVTPEHLNHTYTCVATNAVGNSSVTIKLTKKIKVKWPSLVGYPFVCLLLVTGLGVVLHVKWLEIQIFYRSHFQYGKHDKDEKEFDVFLSYVWSPPSSGAEKGVTLSFQSGPDNVEEAFLSRLDPLNTEEGEDTQAPLELLLPQVLEDRWGYRLCLLERDVLPGGAYTNDVVLAIQRSRMLICLLSAEYLCDSNAVFVLESGVQALLQNSALKLLLIWTSKPSTFFIHLEPLLPKLVQRALKVLPCLDWTSEKPSRGANCSFWRSLRKSMPDHRQHNCFQS